MEAGRPGGLITRGQDEYQYKIKHLKISSFLLNLSYPLTFVKNSLVGGGLQNFSCKVQIN